MDQGEANKDIIDHNSAKFNELKPWNLWRPADYEASVRDLEEKPLVQNTEFKTSKLISTWSCHGLDSVEASKDIIAQFDVKELDSKIKSHNLSKN